MIPSTNSLRAAAWLAGLLLLSAAACTAEPLIPVETFFSLPAISSPELSPDGTKIAFLFPKNHRMALGLFDRKTNEARMVLEGTDESIVYFFWKRNDCIIFGGDVGGDQAFFIGATDLSGKKIKRLAENISTLWGSFATGVIIDPLRHDPEHLLFVQGRSVESVNINNQGTSFAVAIDERDEAFVTDNAGVVRLRVQNTNKNLVWMLRSGSRQQFREIARFPVHGYAESWESQGFAADNVTWWIISREEYERGAVYAYNTATKERGPAVFVPPAGEIESIVTDYGHTKLLGVVYYTDRRHYSWFDQDRAKLQARLERTFAGYDCAIVSSSADDSVHLVRISNDRDPGAYYVLDLKQPALVQFKRIRPDIDPDKMQPMREFNFKARDGLELQGYMTLPAGAEGRRMPLIIHPHGGPFGYRDRWGFDNEVQFLASRGYAVLQVNFRGSGGYGRDFIDKGRRQWGRAMQDDLSDAVKWAVGQGIADPARIAIYGASYGGYAALAGVILTPELYCCAVNYAGPANLEVTFKNRGADAYLTKWDFNFQTEWLGETAEQRNEVSPVRLVDRIRVPTLHAYGEKDPSVKYEHWEALEAQLKKHHKPYEAVTEEHQGHGFRDELASIHFYKTMEAFFARNLAPERPVAAGQRP